jgi:hypothetical protein
MADGRARERADGQPMMADYCLTGIDSKQAGTAEMRRPARRRQIDYSDASVHIFANTHEI